MKLDRREKYQPIQYCWVHISRLLGYLVSYMLFAYRYPTNLLQHADRTAFTLAALMLSCLCAVTIMYKVPQHAYTFEKFRFKLSLQFCCRRRVAMGNIHVNLKYGKNCITNNGDKQKVDFPNSLCNASHHTSVSDVNPIYCCLDEHNIINSGQIHSFP